MTDIRVVVVEDNEFTREGLAAEFSRRTSRIKCVGSYSSFEKAELAIPSLQADVILLDLTLPGGRDGISATRLIRKRWPRLKVLIFSVCEAHQEIVSALAAGAHGYADKTLPAAQLQDCIERVFEGRRTLSLKAADALVRFHNETPLPFDPLSPQEQRVLEESSRGAIDKEIAESMDISEHTVREYKRRIKDSTPGARNVAEAHWIRRNFH